MVKIARSVLVKVGVVGVALHLAALVVGRPRELAAQAVTDRTDDGFKWHSGGDDPGWTSTCNRRR